MSKLEMELIALRKKVSDTANLYKNKTKFLEDSKEDFVRINVVKYLIAKEKGIV